MLLIMFLAEIFLRIFIEGSLTTRRAEVIGLSFIFGCSGGSRGVNIHAADRVVNGIVHLSLLLLDSVRHKIDLVDLHHITQMR